MPVPEISPAELARRSRVPAETRPALLDVRFPNENAYVALPDSVLIPLPELEERADELEALRGRSGGRLLPPRRPQPARRGVPASRGLEAMSLHGGIDLYSEVVDPACRATDATAAAVPWTRPPVGHGVAGLHGDLELHRLRELVAAQLQLWCPPSVPDFAAAGRWYMPMS